MNISKGKFTFCMVLAASVAFCFGLGFFIPVFMFIPIIALISFLVWGAGWIFVNW